MDPERRTAPGVAGAVRAGGRAASDREHPVCPSPSALLELTPRPPPPTPRRPREARRAPWKTACLRPRACSRPQASQPRRRWPSPGPVHPLPRTL